MDFLKRMYYGNALWMWALALGIAFAAFVVFLVLKRVAGSRLSAFAKKTKTDIDDLVAELIRRTSALSLLILALYVGAQVLTLPSAALRIMKMITVIAVLLQAAIWGSAVVTHFITRYAKEKIDEDAAGVTMVKSVGFLVKLGLWSIIILLALDNMGFEISALLAGLGIGGIAVALAAQNVLGDLFASLSIVLDKPFVIGDFIIVGDQMGTIENIGLKTTRVRSLSGEQIVMSNTDLLKSRIRNYKRMQERRAVFSLGVVYQTPAAKLETVPAMLKEIVEAQEKVRFDRAHFREYGDSALNFEVVYYLLEPDYLLYADTQQAINLEIFRRFEKEGIGFAYPTRTLHVESGSPGLPKARFAS
jgi:small-conductance mechanosensitive channel